MMRWAMSAHLIGLALALAGSAQAGERRTAMSERGVVVQILEDAPKGSGPFPVVVLASGAGGDMTQPLLAGLATSLAADGIAVVRFDWAYRTADPAKGQPSADLVAETQDLSAALAFARKNVRFDPTQIVVMGKSLGSVVAFRVFVRNPDLRGAVLLTPLCSLPSRPDAPAWALDPYPDFGGQRRPVALVAGDKDPICSLAALYRMAGEPASPARVAVTGGDHGFAAGAGADPATAEATRRNLDLAARNAADAAAAYLRALPASAAGK